MNPDKSLQTELRELLKRKKAENRSLLNLLRALDQYPDKISPELKKRQG